MQHVLKDKRVLALAQKKAAEEEGKVSGQQWDMEEIVTYVSVVSFLLCFIRASSSSC